MNSVAKGSSVPSAPSKAFAFGPGVHDDLLAAKGARRTARTRASTERVLSIGDSLRLAAAECERQHLHVHTKALGPGGRVLLVTLEDDRAHRANGIGKGLGKQCLASGLFEALEHYTMEHGVRHAPHPSLRVLTIEAIADQEPLGADLLIRRVADEHPGARLRCVEFEKLGGGGSLFYPLLFRNPYAVRLTDPADDQGSLLTYLRYASGSGSASGATERDAILHALLETIERDAHSLAVLEWFAGESRRPLRRVTTASMPADLRALVKEVGDVIGSPPVLLDISSDWNVPVAMALPSRASAWGLYGAGASLDAAYAAERALLELLQQHHTIRERPCIHLERRQRAEAALRPWPALTASARLKPDEVLDRPIREIALGDGASRGTVAEQIEALKTHLGRAGFCAWTHRVNPGHGVPVMSVLVPGAEAFGALVAGGNPVLPIGRGHRSASPS